MLRILTNIRFAIEGLSQAFACALLILSLCALGQPLSAAVPDVEDEDRTDMSASNSFELDVPSVLIRNWYTSPDKKPFFSDRNRLLQGWSVVGFWSPQYPFTPSRYSSFEAKGVGAGIIKHRLFHPDT